MKKILFLLGFMLLGSPSVYAATICTDASGNTMPCTQIIDSGGSNKATVKGSSIPAAQTDTAIVERNSDIGTTTDTPCSLPTSSVACSEIAIQKSIANGSSAPIPPGTNAIGTVSQSNGDPCTVLTHVFTPISMTTITTATIVAGTSGKKTYLCHLFLFSASANNIGVVEGTGANCSTVTNGVIGGTTSANGINLTANQGFESGTGTNAIAATAAVTTNLCIITSSPGPLAGVVVSVQQ